MRKLRYEIYMFLSKFHTNTYILLPHHTQAAATFPYKSLSEMASSEVVLLENPYLALNITRRVCVSLIWRPLKL